MTTRRRAKPAKAGRSGASGRKDSGKIARPALIKQAKGGALYAGGVPGHVGGSGRLPEAIRIRSRDEYDALLDIIRTRRETGEFKDAPLRDLSQLANTVAKYGLGTTITPTDTEGKTLRSGVLAVPVPVASAEWEAQVALAQAAMQQPAVPA